MAVKGEWEKRIRGQKPEAGEMGDGRWEMYRRDGGKPGKGMYRVWMRDRAVGSSFVANLLAMCLMNSRGVKVVRGVFARSVNLTRAH